MSEIGQKLIDEIREIVAKEPDFVFKDHCRYVVAGSPACLIGHGLWNLKLIDEEFENKQANHEDISTITHAVLGLELDEDEEEWLSTVQSLQDSGGAWGYAVETADEGRNGVAA